MALRRASPLERHPLARLVLGRLVVGIGTLLVVSILIFYATEVLPGNAAYAILGHNASAQEVHVLEVELHLNRSTIAQYGSWLGNMLRGNPGMSLAASLPVWTVVKARLINSAVLALVSGLIGTLIAVGLGVVAAARKDGKLDNTLSATALAVTALPEFVVAIALVMLFATIVFRILPGISVLPPGTYAWQRPTLLVLPVASLAIIIVPYIFRMTRAAMIEALESDWVEMARLKGVPPLRVLARHALPNALAPIIQVVALTFLYLAGGIVIVENTFAYPGIGQGLVNAVTTRDIPVIQFIVLALAAFYIVVNILADVAVLLVTPRRRFPR